MLRTTPKRGNILAARLEAGTLQIFLSYAAEDRDLAEPVAFALRARGHKVFFDRDDLPAGGEYDMRIEKAVDQSALFVFLLSPNSVAKGRFTLTELEFARSKWRSADGHVLPVEIRPTPFEEIPNFLKSVTVLRPQGNIAAEVGAAVDPLAQSAMGGQMAVYGGLGIVSGLLTWPAYLALSKAMELAGATENAGDIRLPLKFLGLPVDLCLSGLVLESRSARPLPITFGSRSDGWLSSCLFSQAGLRQCR